MSLLNNNFISKFVSTLDIDKGIAFAKKYMIDFSKEEAKIIVPFLKKNADLISKEKKDILLTKLKNLVNNNTFLKAKKLMEKLIR